MQRQLLPTPDVRKHQGYDRYADEDAVDCFLNSINDCVKQHALTRRSTGDRPHRRSQGLSTRLHQIGNRDLFRTRSSGFTFLALENLASAFRENVAASFALDPSALREAFEDLMRSRIYEA